ncbi:type II toxin-antitoxin system Phd/YefM family antitoxin [Terrimonas alba]|uniref:type II toxin-antitoxin system Phd/YefM family antitoxin n=1 Tax=Terrimonas alba TaxID=3349636 RepID=UPI0035F2E329
MKVVNYTEFKSKLAENLNLVNEDGEIMIVSRSKGKNVLVMSLEEYNAIQETLHLGSSKANAKRIDEAITEMNAGKYLKNKLINR